MIVSKRKLVSESQGAETWARLTGLVFCTNTLFLSLPLSLVLSYAINALDIEHMLTGVYPFFAVAIGGLVDLTTMSDGEGSSALPAALPLIDYRPSMVGMLQ
eukprot:CAMPEP_0174751170 /NCGR_PEP_ID=MMETSP1094-20130205/99259_1 /TAXON_ID=156173 /ORGANISM="Chrysochromulina brevifilum, Strain UTEX LB 985" /LENGTH=101 /DNA_ID=CAMNT_0015956615 /DNA_START=3 /DNA_END=305 /DNA_ORIENTATION=-